MKEDGNRGASRGRVFDRVTDTSLRSDSQSSDKNSGLEERKHVLGEILRSSLLDESSILTMGIAFLRDEFVDLDGLWGVNAWRDTKGEIVLGDLAKLYNYQYDDDLTSGTRWFSEVIKR
jgi:hypothetical protein